MNGNREEGDQSEQGQENSELKIFEIRKFVEQILETELERVSPQDRSLVLDDLTTEVQRTLLRLKGLLKAKGIRSQGEMSAEMSSYTDPEQHFRRLLFEGTITKADFRRDLNAKLAAITLRSGDSLVEERGVQVELGESRIGNFTITKDPKGGPNDYLVFPNLSSRTVGDDKYNLIDYEQIFEIPSDVSITSFIVNVQPARCEMRPDGKFVVKEKGKIEIAK